MKKFKQYIIEDDIETADRYAKLTKIADTKGIRQVAGKMIGELENEHIHDSEGNRVGKISNEANYAMFLLSQTPDRETIREFQPQIEEVGKMIQQHGHIVGLYQEPSIPYSAEVWHTGLGPENWKKIWSGHYNTHLETKK